MSTWKTTRTLPDAGDAILSPHPTRWAASTVRGPRPFRWLMGSPEVHQALLARSRSARGGELVLHEARQAAELVHAAGTEPGVVVVEEDHGALDRVRRVLELLVP